MVWATGSEGVHLQQRWKWTDSKIMHQKWKLRQNLLCCKLQIRHQLMKHLTAHAKSWLLWPGVQEANDNLTGPSYRVTATKAFCQHLELRFLHCVRDEVKLVSQSGPLNLNERSTWNHTLDLQEHRPQSNNMELLMSHEICDQYLNVWFWKTGHVWIELPVA